MVKLVLEKSIAIDAPPTKVWDVVSSPDAMRRWIRVRPDFEGGGLLARGSRVLWKDENGKPYLTGTVVEHEPPRRLVLELDDVSWPRRPQPGEVTYALTLSETQNGTELSLVFGDLSIDPKGRKWLDAYAESGELEAIKRIAESRP